jgi:hypothetical protein
MGQAHSRQCSLKHRSAHSICVRGLFNLQICVVYGVDELGATVRATMQAAWPTSVQCTSQVNSMHLRLKRLMDRIRKVSTKYL